MELGVECRGRGWCLLATLQASCSAFPLSQAELTCQASFVSEYHAQGSVGMELGIETGLRQGRARPNLAVDGQAVLKQRRQDRVASLGIPSPRPSAVRAGARKPSRGCEGMGWLWQERC